MDRTLVNLLAVLVVAALFGAGPGPAVLRADEPQIVKQDFASDPHWDGFRNRLIADEPHVTRQDFGYRRTNHAGGKSPGEIGGFVQRSATPTWYAKVIEPRTLDDRLSASGKLAVREAQGSSGLLFGWFNDSSRGWRTPNSLGVRVDGNGGKYWVFYEYGTKTWETGGGGAFEGEQYQRTKTPPFKADGSVHAWSIDYDPAGHGGDGLVTFRIDDRTYTVALGKGHRAAGATFNRFGIWNVQTSGKGAEMYLDDLVVDGQRMAFDEDPRWEAVGNEARFAEQVYRPLQNFGYSATSHAGAAGEIGGIVFRDEKPAYYGRPSGRSRWPTRFVPRARWRSCGHHPTAGPTSASSTRPASRPTTWPRARQGKRTTWRLYWKAPAAWATTCDPASAPPTAGARPAARPRAGPCYGPTAARTAGRSPIVPTGTAARSP